MSRKHKRVAAMVQSFQGQALDPHYLGYLNCFNRQLFYEAHEVLEHLWLRDKYGPDGAFYKGLIQLAGAFVHLQKNRPQPAVALFKLAHTNLSKYPGGHQHLNLKTICRLIDSWLAQLPPSPAARPVDPATFPILQLSGNTETPQGQRRGQ